MKQYALYCLFMLNLFSLFSCSSPQGELVDKENSLFFHYAKNGKSILYKKEATGIQGTWDYQWITVPADVNSFKVIKGAFGKDKNHVFYLDQILNNVDYATFTIDQTGIVKDKNHVFQKTEVHNGQIRIIAGADPQSFQWLPQGQKDEKWAKDKAHYFMQDTLLAVDYPSFDLLTPYIFKDKNWIYFNAGYQKLGQVKNEDGNVAFTVLDKYIVKTKAHLYYQEYVGKPSITTLKIHQPNSVKLYSYRDYFSVDDVVYYRAKPIDGADVLTFEAIDKKNASIFAKDKNHVYRTGEVVPLANPKTIKFDGLDFHQRFEDDQYSWQYDQQKGDYLRSNK